uniref:Hcy-binding domain-containing protein n=1 Tax=Varanus komodoensis TaxID=61221 RepID=A0A8D2IRG2_VARKO
MGFPKMEPSPLPPSCYFLCNLTSFWEAPLNQPYFFNNYMPDLVPLLLTASKENSREHFLLTAPNYYSSRYYSQKTARCLKCNKGHKVNEAACKIAKEVAQEGDALVAGGISQTPSYLSGKKKAEVKAVFQKQLEIFIKNSVDFLIAEYFEHVEEAVWAVETLKESGLPVAVTLCIGPEGDMHGVPPGECAVQLVKAGASIVGVNCHFDPATCLKTVKLMKEGLTAANLKAHLMSQPLAFHTPDCGKQGFIDLPEFPFALEPRIVSRWDVHKYAREAYNLGIRYIGGCCGFEPYHIRAIAEELAPERGFLPLASEKHGSWGNELSMHTKPWVRARARKEYWENLLPASGRPYCPSLSKPDNWGVTKGDAELMQQKEATTDEQLKMLFEKQKLKSKTEFGLDSHQTVDAMKLRTILRFPFRRSYIFFYTPLC